VKIEKHVFGGKSKNPTLTGREIKVCMKIQDLLSMPKVAMFSL